MTINPDDGFGGVQSPAVMLFGDGRCSRATAVDQLRAGLEGVELELCPHCQADEIAARKADKERADAIDHLARMEKIDEDLRPKEPAPEPQPSAIAGLMGTIAAPPVVANNVPIGSDRLNRQLAAQFPGAETDFSTQTR